MAEVSGSGNLAELDTLLSRFTPREVVLPKGQEAEAGLFALLRQYTQAINPYESWTFDHETAKKTLLDHLKTATLEGFGCGDMTLGVSAAGAALRYIEETQKTALANIRGVSPSLFSPTWSWIARASEISNW